MLKIKDYLKLNQKGIFMCKYIVLLLILAGFSPAFADFSNYNLNNNHFSKFRINRPQNVISTRKNLHRYNRIHTEKCPTCHYLSSNDISALEKYALNKTFKRENDLRRLERLENLAFGTVQNGDIFSRYKNVENAILSRPKYGTKQSIIGNLANYFSGQATGFTPSLTPYPSFYNNDSFNNNPYLFTPNISPSNGFSNNSFERYSNGIFSGGWGHFGQDYGNRSSIRNLD